MAQLIVRKIDEDVKRGLQRRAARHGVSMEEEIRAILRNSVIADKEPPRGLGTEIAELFAGLEGEAPVELPDEPVRPARFEE